jgi:hypothetical protein
MNALIILLVITTFMHGLIAGMYLDVALVKLPTRHRIGVIAYATFAGANDFGNGIIVYPITAISGALLLVATTIIAYAQGQPTDVSYSLYLSVFSTVLSFACTANAAPVMLSLKNASNDELLLKQKLDSFERWNAFRAVFQIISYVALSWSLTKI